MERVALVHDYLTQRGGAERVVLAMLDAFPDAPLYTAFYEPGHTFPAFGDARVQTLALDRLPWLRRHHRVALPVLAPAFSRLRIDATVTICSSSAWAHGAKVSGRKVVYCYTPARFLYQTDRYLEGWSRWGRVPVAALGPALRRWDRRAAATAHRYLVVSTTVHQRVADLYGIDAEVLAPPNSFGPGPTQAVPRVDGGFFLLVSRLLAYKNVGQVVDAFTRLPHQRLVVVGRGPMAARLHQQAGANVVFLDEVNDAELRWLYQSSQGLVAASYEDFGLTPVEAAAFGKPSAVLRWGGFLDTTVEGETAEYFDSPDPSAIAAAVSRMAASTWDLEALIRQADRFSTQAFVTRLHQVVDEESVLAP